MATAAAPGIGPGFQNHSLGDSKILRSASAESDRFGNWSLQMRWMISEDSPLEPFSKISKIQNYPRRLFLFFSQKYPLLDHTHDGVSSSQRRVWRHLRIGFDGIWSLRTFRDCLADGLVKFSYARVFSRSQRM